jgi:hypothetical protein
VRSRWLEDIVRFGTGFVLIVSHGRHCVVQVGREIHLFDAVHDGIAYDLYILIDFRSLTASETFRGICEGLLILWRHQLIQVVG